MEHGSEWVGESWDELKFIRQVRVGAERGGERGGPAGGCQAALVCLTVPMASARKWLVTQFIQIAQPPQVYGSGWRALQLYLRTFPYTDTLCFIGSLLWSYANLLLHVLLLMVAIVASTGCHIPGHWQQAQEDPGRDHSGPVPSAVHPAVVPHQHHVRGWQVHRDSQQRGGLSWLPGCQERRGNLLLRCPWLTPTRSVPALLCDSRSSKVVLCFWLEVDASFQPGDPHVTHPAAHATRWPGDNAGCQCW
jgi:hypothetical protein